MDLSVSTIFVDSPDLYSWLYSCDLLLAKPKRHDFPTIQYLKVYM